MFHLRVVSQRTGQAKNLGIRTGKRKNTTAFSFTGGPTGNPFSLNLTDFYNRSPNGTWQLWVQDFNPGNSGTIAVWSLAGTTVPEPHEYALVAGIGLLGFAVLRRVRSAKPPLVQG